MPTIEQEVLRATGPARTKRSDSNLPGHRVVVHSKNELSKVIFASPPQTFLPSLLPEDTNAEGGVSLSVNSLPAQTERERQGRGGGEVETKNPNGKRRGGNGARNKN